jgi:hypothetical protein
LANTRNPQHPGDVHHQYNDKFLLAEFLTNSMIASVLNILEDLQIDSEKLAKIKAWSATHTVTLRLAAEYVPCANASQS